MTFLFLLLSLLSVPAAPSEMSWSRQSFNEALREARVTDQMVMVALLPDWSDYARAVDDETFGDAEVARASADMLCLRYTRDDATLRQLASNFHVEDFPTILFLDSKGRIEDRIVGFIPPEPMLGELARIQAGETTVSGLEQRADMATDDVDAQYALYDKLINLGEERRAQAALDRIARADPEGQTNRGSMLARQKLWHDVFAALQSDEDELDVTPVVEHVRSRGEASVRFDGWNDVGNVLAGQGDIHGARQAFMAAWADAAKPSAGSWATSVAGWLVADEEVDLTDDERSFTLALAEHGVETALDECPCEQQESCGADNCNLSENDRNAFAAERLGLLARVQLRCAPERKARKLAKATLQRAVKLAPEAEPYQAMLADLGSRR